MVNDIYEPEFQYWIKNEKLDMEYRCGKVDKFKFLSIFQILSLLFSFLTILRVIIYYLGFSVYSYVFANQKFVFFRYFCQC